MNPAASVPLVILAGGLATRLKDLGEATPKYLMPIGDGRVFADYHLDWARNQGFVEVYLCIAHLGEQIRQYCGDGARYGIRISYVDEGSNPRGTGGALRLLPVNQLTLGIALTYGDTLLSVSSEKILSVALSHQAFALMTLFKNSVPGHVNNASFIPGSEAPKAQYSKTQPQAGWEYIDYGYLYLSHEFLLSLPAMERFDLAVPLEEASRSERLLGFEVEKRFWEIGSPEALAEFRRQFG
jgi:NDP-sugar pyrophosphorylase family protein